jgi:glyoxylase-like metal-dependent hydrolase (beta-lactamase superfamily II)
MKTLIGFGLAVALAGGALAQDAKTVLQDASKAMGSPKTIVYSGTGFNGFFGQAVQPGFSWPQRELTGYTRSINYEQKSAKEEFVFKEQVFGGQRQNNWVNGDKAWAVGANGPNPQLAAVEDRQLQILLTPHGFLAAAMAASDATAKRGKKGTVVTFTAMNKYKIHGTIDSQNMVTAVETTVPNPLLGDMDIVCTYSDYKDFGGVKFPTKIKQMQAGGAVADLTIAEVMPNAPVDLPVPANVQSAPAPTPAPATGQKLADGVWLVPTSHNSLVIEFKDFITVVEAPLTVERSLAVIAEAKRLVPNKPIKYLFSTHHHFDHSGGLRPYVAEGATIVTAEVNKAYYEQVFKRKATMMPDVLSKNPKKPVIIGVKDKYVITDGNQSLEIYTTMGDGHAGELLIGYLPKPKILIEADSYSPQAAGAPAPTGPPAPNAVVLYDNLQRLKLDVQTIVPIHGRPVPYADFPRAVGKT